MKIEFIDYNGSYPCLCMGTLKLRIDGKEVVFSDSGEYCECDEDEDKLIYKENCYPRFWTSGGSIHTGKNYKMWASEGPWEIFIVNEAHYTKELLDNMDNLIKVFNDNVPYGCCGGCI